MWCFNQLFLLMSGRSNLFWSTAKDLSFVNDHYVSANITQHHSRSMPTSGLVQRTVNPLLGSPIGNIGTWFMHVVYPRAGCQGQTKCLTVLQFENCLSGLIGGWQPVGPRLLHTVMMWQELSLMVRPTSFLEFGGSGQTRIVTGSCHTPGSTGFCNVLH